MIRLFAAVPVPDDIAQALAPRQTGVSGARWRPADALHVTLRFFGDIPHDRAEDVDAELAAVTSPPFEISLEGAGVFGEGRDIHALWAGVAESAPLRRLAERCETAARRAGLRPAARNYRPHVTLAYVTRPDPQEAAAWIPANNLLRTEPWRVTWFSLYSSRLMPGGSRYEVERDYPLLG